MRDADLTGVAGRAWALVAVPVFTRCLSAWLLNLPDLQKSCTHYLLSVEHLRSTPVQHKAYAEATHATLFFAIDPKYCPNPHPDPIRGYPVKLPPLLLYHFTSPCDTAAIRVVELLAQKLTQGQSFVMRSSADWLATLDRIASEAPLLEN